MCRTKPIAEQDKIPKKNWIALFGALLGAFMAILDIQITNSSLQDIQGALSATMDESSWISTAYLVTEMIAIPLSGWLAKSLGTRRYLTWTTLIFVFASILCSMAWNMSSMIVFRALQGFSGGALIPLAFSLVVKLLPRHKRALGMTLFGLTATFAPSIGPTLGGWLTDTFSWHYIFYLNIPPAIALILMINYGLEDEPINFDTFIHADWFGIFTMALGLGCLEVVLEEGNKNDWFTSKMIITLAIISVVSLIYFVINELQHKKALVNLRLFINKQFLMSGVSYFILGMSLFGSIYVLSTYMLQVLSYNAFEVGKVLMWSGMPQLIIFPLMPYLTKKIHAKYLVSFGFSLLALSCYVNTSMDLNYAGDQLIFSMILRAVGNPFVLVPLSLVALKGVKHEQISEVSTLTNVARTLGGATCIAMISTILQNKTLEHFNRIKSTLSNVNTDAWYYIQQKTAMIMQSGSDLNMATLQAKLSLLNMMQRDATIMAYNDVFFILMVFLGIAAFLMLFVEKGEL